MTRGTIDLFQPNRFDSTAGNVIDPEEVDMRLRSRRGGKGGGRKRPKAAAEIIAPGCFFNIKRAARLQKDRSDLFRPRAFERVFETIRIISP